MNRWILLSVLSAIMMAPTAHAQRDPSTGRGRSDEAHGRADEAHGRSDEAHERDDEARVAAGEAEVRARALIDQALGPAGRAEAREQERGRSWRSTARRLGLDPEHDAPSAIDAQMRAELTRHARRVARIERVRVLGVELARPEVVTRAERLLVNETARHERRLASIAGHPLAPAVPEVAIAIDPAVLVAPAGTVPTVTVTPPSGVAVIPQASGVVVTPPAVVVTPPPAGGE